MRPKLNLPATIRRFRRTDLDLSLVDPNDLDSALRSIREWGRYIDGALEDLMNPPRCQVSRSVAQTVNNVTNTTLGFDTVIFDALKWHTYNAVTDTSRITPTRAGLYRVSFGTDWALDNDYLRVLVNIFKNGAALTPNLSDERGGGAVNLTPNQIASSPLIEMDGVSDYLELIALQSNTSAAASTVSAVWLVEYVP